MKVAGRKIADQIENQIAVSSNEWSILKNYRDDLNLLDIFNDHKKRKIIIAARRCNIVVLIYTVNQPKAVFEQAFFDVERKKPKLLAHKVLLTDFGKELL